MKQSLLLFISLIAAGTAFAQQQKFSYTVEGTLSEPDYQGKMIYISTYDNNQKVDSTRLENGHFRFQGEAASSTLCRVHVERKYGSLILEKGNIKVDLAETRIASGTPLNEELRAYVLKSNKLLEELKQTYEHIKDSLKDEKEARQFAGELYSAKYRPLLQTNRLAFFDLHPNDAIGEYLIRELAQESTPEEMDKVFAKAGPKLMALQFTQKIKKQFDALKQTVAGKMFVDFEAKDENDKPLSLSAYVGKGKYTLVDFWASWCGPCRKESKTIAKVYELFKDKGLQVVGVATWDQAKDTKKAVQNLNITWPQLFDAGTKPSELYGFNGIPQVMLFGPDGTIIARDLRGENIQLKLEEFFK